MHEEDGAQVNNFFFQAEDGIRDIVVTGVQTCALPIYQTDLVEHMKEGDRFESKTWDLRSEEHTSELQSRQYLVCRLLLEKKIKSIHANILRAQRAKFHSAPPDRKTT